MVTARNCCCYCLYEICAALYKSVRFGFNWKQHFLWLNNAASKCFHPQTSISLPFSPTCTLRAFRINFKNLRLSVSKLPPSLPYTRFLIVFVCYIYLFTAFNATACGTYIYHWPSGLKGLNVTLNVPNTIRVILTVWVVRVGLVEVTVTDSCRVNVTN